MTEIFYEQPVVATILFTIGLIFSQLNVFVLKKFKGNEIDGLHAFYQNTIAFSENKARKGFLYFVFLPLCIYVIYHLTNGILNNFIFNVLVVAVSGSFALMVSLSISSLLAAFVFLKNSDTMLDYLSWMYVILIALAFIYSILYFLTWESFFLNAFVFSSLIGMINVFKVKKAKAYMHYNNS
jgi:lysylphosphatidylglycerol synthetase-like protein (DUF2156 family)